MRAESIGQSVGKSWSSEAHLLLSATTSVTPLSILLFGKDAMLLQTRQWLLERSGYAVRTASDLGELERMAAGGRVDLLILCHSLSAEDGRQAIAAISARQPQARILALVTSPSTRIDTRYTAIVDTGEGPARLLSSVASLVGATGSRTVERSTNGLRSDRR